MKKIVVTIVALAVLGYAISASAQTPVFSNDPADYGAELDYDSTADTVGLVIDVQLAQGITLDAMLTFETTYITMPTWLTTAVWDEIKGDKVAMVGLLLGTTTAVPADLSCVLLAAATADKGDKIQCTQVTKADLTALSMTLDEFKAWLEYYYIFLMDGMDTSTHKAFSIPLNVSALVSKGIAAVDTTCDVTDATLDCDDDGVLNLDDNCQGTPAGETVDADGCSDSQLTDVCDTSVDPDCDGVIGDADLCPDEWGDGEDGCPIAAAPDEVDTVSDGGGCSLILP